ncbi:hypothetical protein Cfor_07928 [Coptotermes formosanus]|uniref:Uncharacterized protein n=1 Tax=Coptotermes formosanus TaxID=36987 RepID=A0A6L2PMV2_COPFO|nr:hypothetical protein Cfor_07928 [Coptotermes formosanus]
MTDNATQRSAVVPQESKSDGTVDVNKLADGLLALYEPQLKKVQQQLDELIKKQMTLIDQLQDENSRFTNVQTSDDLQQMFMMVKLYQTKLVVIKKEMLQLHDRATKLKQDDATSSTSWRALGYLHILVKTLRSARGCGLHHLQTCHEIFTCGQH